MMTGVQNTFELMVSALGRRPPSSFVLFPLFNGALDLPQGAYLAFPRTREYEAAEAHSRTLFAAYGIRLQDTFYRPPNRRLYTKPHIHEYLAGLYTEWEERLARVDPQCPKRFGGRPHAASISDDGGGHAGGSEPGTGERPVSKGGA